MFTLDIFELETNHIDPGLPDVAPALWPRYPMHGPSQPNRDPTQI